MIRERWSSFKEAYRTRRWVRWPVDAATVLLLMVAVAFLHGLLFGSGMLQSASMYRAVVGR